MKTVIQYILLLCLLGLSGSYMLVGADPETAEKAEASDDAVDLKALGDEMAGLWGEKVCVAEPGSKHEEQVISIACNAEYTSAERDKVLDFLFKKGFLFRGESYDIKGTTGHYWYRFEHREGNRLRSVFVRMHITSQGALWGSVKPPARVAIYVDNLATADELTAWQTLGIPLSFGLKPTENAKELAQQIDEYKQEAWLALDLRQGAFTEPDQSASVRDIIEQDLIPNHLKNSLEQTGDVWGIVVRDLNNITTTVATARAVFSAIKAEGKSYVLLPAKYNKALSTTANVMDMNARRVTYDMGAMCAKSPAKIWSYIRSKAGHGQVIVRFPANAKRCAHTLSRTLRRDGKTEFRPLSTFFGYAEGATTEKKAGAGN
ncbi:MAG: hypothetical protein ACOY5B_01545 [Spirochaetota bacterium]